MYSQFSCIFETSYFNLEKAHSLEYKKNNEPYYRITGPDSVISSILDRSDNFIMVRQYRPNLEVYTIETPAGGIEKGEVPIDAMHREIREETGLICNLLPLGKHFSLMMNRTSISDFLFFGMFPEEVPDYKTDSDTEVVRVPRRDLLEMSLEGKYIQLAGLGILQLASGILGVDMWRSDYNRIERNFKKLLRSN